MASGNETFFDVSQIIQDRRIVLTEGHVNSILARELRNPKIHQGAIACGTNIPSILVAATAIQGALQNVENMITMFNLAYVRQFCRRKRTVLF
jgi:hypothetical protein